MKRALLCVLMSGTLGVTCLTADSDKPKSDSFKLEQQYMVKRAEWLKLRSDAAAEINKAKTEEEKNRIRKKLIEDDRALRAASADLAAKLKAAKKAELPAAPNLTKH